MTIENCKGLAHIGFYVRDVEVSKKYYCDTFGFQPIFERTIKAQDGRETILVTFLKLGELVLEMMPEENRKISSEGRFQHLAIRVQNIEDAEKKLDALGIKHDELVDSKETFPNGSKWVTFLGPDGEHLEFTEVL